MFVVYFEGWLKVNRFDLSGDLLSVSLDPRYHPQRHLAADARPLNSGRGIPAKMGNAKWRNNALFCGNSSNRFSNSKGVCNWYPIPEGGKNKCQSAFGLAPILQRVLRAIACLLRNPSPLNWLNTGE